MEGFKWTYHGYMQRYKMDVSITIWELTGDGNNNKYV